MDEIFDNDFQMALVIGLIYIFASYGGSIVLQKLNIDGTQNNILHRIKRVCDFNKNNMFVVLSTIVIISYFVLLYKDECNVYQFKLTNIPDIQQQQIQQSLNYDPLHASVSSSELKHNLQRFFATL